MTCAVQLDGARCALPLSSCDGRRPIGAAADDFIETHLPLMTVWKADDGHAEVQKIGDDREQGDLLAAVLRATVAC